MKLTLYHRLFHRHEKGQVLVIVVFAFIGLLIMVGLVTDGALLYVNNAHLRQAVDAGAVAAVGQYRKGRDIEELHAAAVEVVKLQLPSGLNNVETYWCPVTGPGDEILNYAGEYYQPYTDTHGLCPTPPRKLVRVKACLDVDLVFLPIAGAGFEQVTLCAQAEAEAALLNLVLLLDTSESMAYGTGSLDSYACPRGGYPHRAGPDLTEFSSFAECLRACSGWQPDGTFSSTPGDYWCSPFEDVRDAAANFVNMMRDGVDSVAVYHFDKTPVLTQSVDSSYSEPVTIHTSIGLVVPLTSTLSNVTSAINDNSRLHVYVRPQQPGQDPAYMVANYRWTNTNIGGGLREATDELVDNGQAEAIWVIVLLTDGAANATDKTADENDWWSCPQRIYSPWCRDPESTDADPTDPDPDAVTRHCPSVKACSDSSMCLNPDDPGTCWYTDWGETITETVNYDADDYARDRADTAAAYEIVLFTIGFGEGVIDYRGGGRVDAGERLLRYIADVGDDGDRSTAPCGSDFYWDYDHVQPLPGLGENCGNYYYAPDKDELEDVFEAIAARVFLRITE